MTAIHWKNAANGTFNTAADWNPASTPGAADDAIIDAIGTYTVTSSQNTTVNSVDTISGATLAIAAGTTFQATNGGVNAGKITVADGATFAISSLDNVGSVALNGSKAATSLEFVGAVNILGGNGQITLSANAHNQIIADGSNRTVDNLSDTITGGGRIGDLADTHLTFINDHSGVINANGKVALDIKTGNTFTNNGTMEATSSGGLHIEDVVNQLGGGTILAAGSKAHVDLDKSVIIGGTLATSGGGKINTLAGSNATILGFSTIVDGSLNIVDNSTLFLNGLVTNEGNISLGATTNATQIVVTGNSGIIEGQVTLSDNAKNAIITNGANHLFENGATLTGAGTIGDSHMSFDNLATINATGKNELIIAANFVANSALMEATGTGHLTIAANVTNGVGAAIEALGTSHVVLENTVISNTKATIGVLTTGAHLDIGTVAAGGTAEVDNGAVVNVAGGLITTIVGANQATPTSFTIKDATVQNAGTITVSDNSKLVLNGTANEETVSNSGTIAIKGATKATSLVIDGTNGVTLTGSGKITLTDDTHNFIASNGTDTVLDNVDNTISGSGTFGDSHLAWSMGAAGVINATGATHQLFIEGKGFAANAGTIELTGKAGLQIDALIDNSGSGQVLAASKSGVLTLAGQIDGGSLSATVSGATIRLDDGFTIGTNDSTVVGSTITTTSSTMLNGISQVHNAGTITVVNNSALSLSGAVFNTGTINVSSTGQVADLGANATLVGHGKLVMTDDVHNTITSHQGVTVSNSSSLLNFGGSVTAGDILSLVITDGVSFSATETVVTTAGMTTTQIASAFAAEISEDITLALHNVQAASGANFLAVVQPGDAGLATSVTKVFSAGATETVSGTGNLAGGQNDGVLFENVDNTITGAGTIGSANTLIVHNDAAGVVNANGTHLMTIDTGFYTVVNAGIIEATGTGGLDIKSEVANFGHLIANNSTLEVDGTLTGFGGAQILGSGKLDFEAVNNFQDVNFGANSTGQLDLAHSMGYLGRISGFGTNTSQSIDLEDITFAGATRTWTPAGSNIEGILNVTDGAHSVNLTLLGHYVTGNFTLHDDGTGHVLVTDPPLHGHGDLLMH